MTGWVDRGAERVPFTLLGGYLGAGKTTLLNRLLADPGDRRLVVLVNDVGAVNVDAALVARHDGPTLALANGCVCCTIDDDFGRTLEQVRSLPDRPDHVVMELSGVAEPARLAPWASTTGFRLDGIVVVADADQIVELADRRYVGDTIRTQLASADLVLLAKTDLAADGGDAARRFVRTAGADPSVPVLDAVAADPRAVFGVGTGRAAEGSEPSTPHDVGHAVSVVDASGLTRDELDGLVAGLPATVVRAKGLVRCVDADDPLEVHVVGRRRVVRVRRDLRAVSPGDPSVDALVVIEAG